MRCVLNYQKMREDTKNDYYSNRLSAQKLWQVYEIAPPRIQQYLEAELNHVLQAIQPGDLVLEMGCGYGRVITSLTQKARWVVGIDTSYVSISFGREMLSNVKNHVLIQMDAIQLAFCDQTFDKVVCIQNGISAFHVNQRNLIQESIRVTKPGGLVLFSSYSDRFWKDRLAWFQMQSDAGLLGEIDYGKTRDGIIVCRDGFTATTVPRSQFQALTVGFDVDVQIIEVDDSSLFCVITVR